jgi:predicted phage replisome organizer
VADNKKYYWLKLKRDFFKRHDIKVIESMPNGKDYILFYLKLLCESVDHNGNLRFNDEIPYNEQMLAAITNTNIDTVHTAVELFSGLQMMEILDDGTYYMAKIDGMIGSAADNDNAKRQARFKEKKKQALLECVGDSVTKSNAEVTECVTKSNERKREEKELDKDIDIEIERENECSPNQSTETDFVDLSTDLSTTEDTKRKMLGGELGKGVVFLSQEQIDDLLDKLSIEEFDHYVSVVADCILNGKPFKRKTHYKAILDMAQQDRKTN